MAFFDRIFPGQELPALKTQLEDQRARLSVLESELLQAVEAAAAADRDRARLKATLEEAQQLMAGSDASSRQEIEALQAERTRAETRAEELAATLSACQRRNDDLVMELGQLRAQAGSLGEEMQRLSAELSRVEADRQKRSEDHALRESRLAEKSAAVKAEREKAEELLREVRTRETRWRQEIEPELRALEAYRSLEARRGELAGLSAALDLKEQALDELGRDLARRGATEADLARRETEVRASAEAQSRQQSDLAAWQSRLDAQEAGLDGREQKLQAWAIELGELQSRVDRLDAEEERLAKLEARLEKRRLDQQERHHQQALELARKRDELKRMESDLQARGTELRAQERRHGSLEKRVSELQTENKALRSHSEQAETELASIRPERDRLKKRLAVLEPQVAGLPQPGIRSEALLRWFVQDGGRASLSMGRGSRLACSGTGPYDGEAFEQLLERAGIREYLIGYPDITHVVVGREGWSEDDLLDQIGMRSGRSLRVYSQEMVLAALATGRDPLECGDDEVLEAFMRGHPALELLAGGAFEWPSVQAPDTSRIDEIGPESLGVEESPLHVLGYVVGTTRGLDQKSRREILLEALQAAELPWVESDEYMSKWGAGHTHQRLWRIACHLALLINRPMSRDWRLVQARQEWIEDLEWLHGAIYKRRHYRFVWPAITVD